MSNQTVALGKSELDRLALMTYLVNKVPGIGRTAIMKLIFFMKELKNVPVPYNFRLYTYGPFDSKVLDDLQYAELLGVIKSALVHYSETGAGYRLEIGPNAAGIEGNRSEYIQRYREGIDWVIAKFGSRTASELEMASTLIYIDRIAKRDQKEINIVEISRKVHDIKSHLKVAVIESEARKLRDDSLLQSVT